jgi:hypothetical protein
LEARREIAAPEELSEWVKVWAGSLIELSDDIEAQLRCATDQLVGQLRWLRAGRSRIEPHLLRLAYPTIVRLLKKERLRISNFELLVAYAHASGLHPYKNSLKGDNPIDALKAQLFRAKKSDMGVAVLSRMLANGASWSKSKYQGDSS